MISAATAASISASADPTDRKVFSALCDMTDALSGCRTPAMRLELLRRACAKVDAWIARCERSPKAAAEVARRAPPRKAPVRRHVAGRDGERSEGRLMPARIEVVAAVAIVALLAMLWLAGGGGA